MNYNVYYYNQCTSSTWHWTKEHDNTIYIATYVKGVSTTYVFINTWSNKRKGMPKANAYWENSPQFLIFSVLKKTIKNYFFEFFLTVKLELSRLTTAFPSSPSKYLLNISLLNNVQNSFSKPPASIPVSPLNDTW